MASIFNKGEFMNRLTERSCACCGQVKEKNLFHESLNKHHASGVLPFCKTCCSALWREYSQKLKSPKAGLWCLCAEVGIPFIQDVWNLTEQVYEAAQGKGRKPDLFLTYLRTFKEKKIPFNGFWDSDVMLDDIVSVVTKTEEIALKQKQVDLESEVVVWGRFVDEEGKLDPIAYEYLNNSFYAYTDHLGEMDANLINRYRDLAKCEWRLRKANEKGDGTEISKAQDSLNKQLTLLGLNNFKKDYESEEKRAFEKRNAMIEHYKPSECEDLKKYVDMAGYEKEMAINMRSLRNAVAGTRDYPEIPAEER